MASTNSYGYQVPLRSTLESMGYKVDWQGEGKPIKASKGGKSYDITPGMYEF
ncbi:stalk domain-containing protein [Neomoorella mulderi]|uniref:Copper amine oxidase-like N-terminal domain-containing protein n=1 Tax=Moorella mulderi DSM 14980 TaxID=1122241 RepID=A0A151AU82_9FIRM|nr:stalk domain-containing protein [Moorella mulderi]KYH31132.1 hypothetical protein MOMUL_26650 [Moorella mulderi DSM 14980]